MNRRRMVCGSVSVFDDIPRPDARPPDQHETAFSYLNRSGRIEAARVRQLADSWFTHYPVTHRDTLIARFQSLLTISTTVHFSSFPFMSSRCASGIDEFKLCCGNCRLVAGDPIGKIFGLHYGWPENLSQ